MDGFLDFATRRPVTTAALGVGGVLAFLFLFSGSGGGGSGGDVVATVSAPDANAQLSAATQLQMAQLQANNDARLMDAQTGLELTKLAATYQLGQLQLQAQDTESERQARLDYAKLMYADASDARATQLQGDLASMQSRLYLADLAQEERVTIASNAQAADLQKFLGSVALQQTSLETNAQMQAAQYAANAQVAAAKASKKKGFSFGPFSISF